MAFQLNAIISSSPNLTSPNLPILTSKLCTTTTTTTISRNSIPNHSAANRRLSMSISTKAAPADLQFNPSTTTPTSTCWAEFADKVSGEWDGYGADFEVDGKPVELPDYVVPEAYKEWEVKVFDWQTQCPTLAEPRLEHEQHPSMFYKLIKLLPTVGCEADAATRYTVDERNVGGLENGVEAFAYERSGCYVAVWRIKEEEKVFELEHCLVDPKNREVRVRVVQVVAVDNSSGLKFGLRSVKVFCEQWYGPFRNGDQLGGCSIRDSSFAASEALQGGLIDGVWRSSSAVASFEGPSYNYVQELTGEILQENTRNKEDLILLPRQLWCSLKETVDGGSCGEVGWLLDQGRAITSRCVFSSDVKPKEITIAMETGVF